MRHGLCWMVGGTLLAALGCGDSGTGPVDDSDGKRLASQFERLADSVDGAGYSPTAEALRHAAEIVRLTGHATPVTLTIDGASRCFLSVAEQLDFPNLQCSWPADSGIAQPGDTVVVPPADSGGGTSSGGTVTAMDSVVNPPVPGSPGECTEVGTYSMRTLIAWEPNDMTEVVRIVADVGSNGVEIHTPDVMTGLPTNTSAGETDPGVPPSAPNDSTGGGGGSGGYPGFMGEYLVRELGSWFAVEGSETNALEDSGGACTSDRVSFDWAEFDCEAARFRFEFTMRVEPLRVVGLPQPVPEMESSPDQPEGSHTLAMAAMSVDRARLSVVAWTPPPLPVPGLCRLIRRWQGTDQRIGSTNGAHPVPRPEDPQLVTPASRAPAPGFATHSSVTATQSSLLSAAWRLTIHLGRRLNMHCGRASAGLARRQRAHGRYAPPSHSPSVRRDHAPGRVVGTARDRLPRAVQLHRLRDLGCVPGQALRLRAVPLAVLLTGAVGQLAARVVGP